MKSFTDMQMRDFAVFCSRTHRYNGKDWWYSHDEKEAIVTSKLFERWLRQQVPQLSDPNDLKDIQFR